MKKTLRIFSVFILWGACLPSLFGLGISALWNAILAPACGVAAISFIQGVGLFLLGQLLSGGILLGIFLLGAMIHGAVHGKHPHHLHNQWHNMSAEQRKQMIKDRMNRFKAEFIQEQDGSATN